MWISPNVASAAVVLLSAPAQVILKRIAQDNQHLRQGPAEQVLILHHLATVEPMLRTGCTYELDASRPLDEVVADLTAISEASPEAS